MLADNEAMRAEARRPIAAFLYGAPIGTLGGLIGLGGAEFRLPVLKAALGYPTLRAVALNLAVSLVTLVASLAIRARSTSLEALEPLLPVMGGLVAGAMLGANTGAAYASRISVARLERLIMILLVAIGGALVVEAFVPWRGAGVPFGLEVRLPLAAALGFGIGVASSLLGVAGGELIIPTLVFVFGADVKIAGTASVMISLPTVIVGLARYARKGSFVREDAGALIVPMGVGSIAGALAGGLLVPFVPAGMLKLVLGAILIVSAIRIFRHASAPLRIATTTSVCDAGLLPRLLQEFERRAGRRAQIRAVGSGEALELLRAGEAEVAVTHAPELEEEARVQGLVASKTPFVANAFVIVGPPDAAAGVAGARDAVEAMRRISGSRRPFVSRADGSGTHHRERALWARAGVAADAPFIIRAGAGMAETLRLASARAAFTLSDRATFLRLAAELELTIVFEGNGELRNVYSVLVPAGRSGDTQGATELVRFLVSPECRTLVDEFRPTGETLFATL